MAGFRSREADDREGESVPKWHSAEVRSLISGVTISPPVGKKSDGSAIILAEREENGWSPAR
jgi:hypothetical protein